MFHSLVFATSSKLIPAGYHSFTMLNVSFLYRKGIIRDDQITSSLTAVSHSGHISNYLSAASTAVQFTNAHKPHPVQTCHPIATKNKYVINTIWQHTTLQLLLLTCLTTQKGNCHRQSDWCNLYIFGHNTLNFLQTLMDIMPWTAYQSIAFNTWNCLQALNTKHILYVQKKQLVSQWCPVVATPDYIHHHTSNHNLKFSSLSLCSVFSTVQLLLQQTPSDTGDMSCVIWKPSYIYCIWTSTQQKQFSG